MSTGHRGWAIEALTKLLLGNLQNFKSTKIEVPQSRRHLRSIKGFMYLPKADLHFFMQQDLLVDCFNRGWISDKNPLIVRYTHNNKEMSNYKQVFQIASSITTENSKLKKEMVQLGIEKEKINILPHPIKWELFSSVKDVNKTRDVIFVSNFYKRKRPDIIADLIRANPHVSFTLYGKNWEYFPLFAELLERPNFQYLSFNYHEYARVLAKHRVFCSVSDIEGGPVPLLESLTAGLIPVVTDTGYARDVIPQNLIDYIVPTSPEIDLLSRKIQVALKEKSQNVDTFKYGEKRFIEAIMESIHSCIA